MHGGENEVRIPDVELLIQAAQSDVALVSIYIPADIHGEAEVVLAVCDTSELGAIRAVLQVALKALYTQNWLSMDELDPSAVSEEEGFST